MEALGTIAAAMDKGGFRPHLLYGITGSGKTTVYFAAMRRALDAGKSALLLVPEIGLTPAMAAQMYAAFEGEVALLHSQLTPDERAEQWHRIRRGEARIVVGTRSAVFAPMVNLGLIIVDEEHDSSYKQEETPRYHGRDVAVMRAKLNEAVVVLGSATPSLESWANADKGRYARVEMRERVMERPLPAVELVDMRTEFRETGQEHIFSRKLIEETQAHARSWRAGDSTAEPAGVFDCGDVPQLRRKDRVRELRDLDDLSQEGERERCDSAAGAEAGVSLLRVSARGAEGLSEVRERTSLLSGGGIAAGRGAAAGAISGGADRTDGSRHRTRTQRHGAAAGAAAWRRDQPARGDADDCKGA